MCVCGWVWRYLCVLYTQILSCTCCLTAVAILLLNLLFCIYILNFAKRLISCFHSIFHLFFHYTQHTQQAAWHSHFTSPALCQQNITYTKLFFDKKSLYSHLKNFHSLLWWYFGKVTFSNVTRRRTWSYSDGPEETQLISQVTVAVTIERVMDLCFCIMVSQRLSSSAGGIARAEVQRIKNVTAAWG